MAPERKEREVVAEYLRLAERIFSEQRATAVTPE
jgi:hypothetical protein